MPRYEPRLGPALKENSRAEELTKLCPTESGKDNKTVNVNICVIPQVAKEVTSQFPEQQSIPSHQPLSSIRPQSP